MDRHYLLPRTIFTSVNGQHGKYFAKLESYGVPGWVRLSLPEYPEVAPWPYFWESHVKLWESIEWKAQEAETERIGMQGYKLEPVFN